MRVSLPIRVEESNARLFLVIYWCCWVTAMSETLTATPQKPMRTRLYEIYTTVRAYHT